MGQVAILNCLAAYKCVDGSEAKKVIECALPKLQHANYAVVLACIRLIINHLQVEVFFCKLYCQNILIALRAAIG